MSLPTAGSCSGFFFRGFLASGAPDVLDLPEPLGGQAGNALQGSSEQLDGVCLPFRSRDEKHPDCHFFRMMYHESHILSPNRLLARATQRSSARMWRHRYRGARERVFRMWPQPLAQKSCTQTYHTYNIYIYIHTHLCTSLCVSPISHLRLPEDAELRRQLPVRRLFQQVLRFAYAGQRWEALEADETSPAPDRGNTGPGK